MGHAALASVDIARYRVDEALGALGHSLSLIPCTWQVHYEMSRALAGKRDYMGGLYEIETAYKDAPRSFPFFHLIKASGFHCS